MNRRKFLSYASSLMATGTLGMSAGNARLEGLFTLNYLNALNIPNLTPFFSERATQTHYVEHYLSDYSTLIQESTSFNEHHLYNSCVNHQHYWKGLSTKPSMPNKYIERLICDCWGGMSGLFNGIKCTIPYVYGSGWIVVDAPSKGTLNLKIVSNDEIKVPSTSLLTIDLWEHAYYIDFLYDVEAYVDTIFKLIDWNIVNKRIIDADSKYIA